MANQSQFTIDTVNSTAELTLFIDYVEITSYTYSGGNVTLAPLVDPAVLTQAALQQSLSDIARWAENVASAFGLAVSGRPMTRECYERFASSVTYTFEVNSSLLSNAAYSDSTQLFTFQPRAQFVLTWTEFMGWIKFLKNVVRIC